jgi:hypothetical protein
LPGAEIAAVKLSPLPRHFVPPKMVQVPIPPKWRDVTAPETTVPDWRKRLVGSHCRSRAVDMVVTRLTDKGVERTRP